MVLGLSGGLSFSGSSLSVYLSGSMKNIRGCHALGIKTVLVAGAAPAPGDAAALKAIETAHSMLQPGERPNADAPEVDVALPRCADMEAKLPWLFEPAREWPHADDPKSGP